MKLVRIGAATLNQTPLDWVGNKARIYKALNDAVADGVGLLCLPELSITGYGCEDHFHAGDVQTRAVSTLFELSEFQGLAFCVGLPVLYKNALYNCTAFISNGEVQGLVPKQNLAGDGIHYEPRWFKAWPSGKRDTVRMWGVDVPIGDLIFDVGGVRIGFEICEDAWVASRPGASLARRGVDIIMNPSASHFAFGKYKTRRQFVQEGSRAFAVTYVYTNLLGNESGRAIYDGGALIASAGRVVAEGPRFSFTDSTLSAATVDIDETRTVQSRTASFSPQVGEDANTISSGHLRMAETLTTQRERLAEWESSPFLMAEEFTRAVSLGLFDYLRKSRSSGFVVSLSGGADSAACAVLVHSMVHLAASELKPHDGSDNPRNAVLERLFGVNHTRERSGDLKSLVGDLLTCVYQPTRNSSETTLVAAREVASGVGAKFHVLDVDEVVQGYISRVSGALGRALDWEHDDLALQNIQARARAPGVWMIANILNSLLLVTSNRSEAAVGYCTMDGDTSGSICPIGGIDKHFLRGWLDWMSRYRSNALQSPVTPTVPPISELSYILNQAPTAELRPQTEGQTDEKDLMPYLVLDTIERCAIRDKKSPREVYITLRAHYSNESFTREDLLSWVTKFFRLWARNQWKRERLALSFHVDDEDLDPRAWCRFPVLNSGFEVELADLKEEVARDRSF